MTTLLSVKAADLADQLDVGTMDAVEALLQAGARLTDGDGRELDEGDLEWRLDAATLERGQETDPDDVWGELDERAAELLRQNCGAELEDVQ